MTSSPKNPIIQRLPWRTFLFVGLLFVFYLLPYDGTSEACSGHQAIVSALMAGNSWGRQAFVGNLDYPALQTICLVVSDTLAHWLHLEGARLLRAFAEALILFFFIGTVSLVRRIIWSVFPLVIALALPLLRGILVTCDIEWVPAIPLAGLFFYLMRWERGQRLMDLVWCACCCGAMTLCGLGPGFLGVVIALSLCWWVKRVSRLELTGGIGVLIGMPVIYCILLWLLWNWLVMGSWNYGLSEMAARMATLKGVQISAEYSAHPWTYLLCLAFLSPMVILCRKSMIPMTSRVMAPLTLACCIVILFSRLLNIASSSVMPLLFVTVLGFASLAIAGEYPKVVPRNANLLAVMICLGITLKIPLGSLQTGGWEALALPPSQADLAETIDRTWPDSRVMLYGLRLPIVYQDNEEKRFVARLDYQEEELLKQAVTEQLHLLLPPPGQYHTAKNRQLLTIYEQGAPWLLLEKKWPGGWQLWRVVIPPKGESHLEL